jgi:hypothetical protein
MYLPSWEFLRKKVNSVQGGCHSCKGSKIAWREFLQWYKDNPRAIQELKVLTSSTQIDFWNNLVHPPVKVVV